MLTSLLLTTLGLTTLVFLMLLGPFALPIIFCCLVGFCIILTLFIVANKLLWGIAWVLCAPFAVFGWLFSLLRWAFKSEEEKKAIREAKEKEKEERRKRKTEEREGDERQNGSERQKGNERWKRRMAARRDEGVPKRYYETEVFG